MPKVAVLHTSLVFLNVEPMLLNLFEELLPDVEVVHFVDSDVLATVMREGEISSDSAARMRYLAQAADTAHVDAIFSACSSLGPAVDSAREHVSCPVVKVDEAMARTAVDRGGRVGVLATVPTTLGPTMDLIRSAAADAGKSVEVVDRLAEGAFARLMAGDADEHDAMVRDAAIELASDIDVLVLAQASMTRLAPTLAEATGLEVLTSPRLGVLDLKRVLGGG